MTPEGFLAVIALCYFAQVWFFVAGLQQKKELRHFSWFELYFTVYVLFLPFLVLFGGKVIWKGRIY